MAVMISNIHVQIPINGILPSFNRAQTLKEQKSFMDDEQDLLTALRDLEPQAITQAHSEYFPIVYRYACYRLGDDTVAEDLASETFIRLLESLHAGRGPDTSLRGWLMGTISNLINDYFRQVYNKPTEPLGEAMPDQSGDPVSQSERSDQQAALRKALSNLTTDQQHVLALRFGSGCSLAETAEIMRKNTNTIKQLQFRALVALRDNMRE